jgi:hypothetical protein
MLGARVGKGTAGGGGSPAAAAMARRGGAGGSGWRGGGEHMAPLYTRELGWRRVTTEEHLPCYGASAGACTTSSADGPGVRRAHGACTAAWRRGSRRPGVEASVGRRGPRAAHGLGLRSHREGAQARPSRVGRRRQATRGARARDDVARWCPTRHSVAEPSFEIEFLQKFE